MLLQKNTIITDYIYFCINTTIHIKRKKHPNSKTQVTPQKKLQTGTHQANVNQLAASEIPPVVPLLVGFVWGKTCTQAHCKDKGKPPTNIYMLHLWRKQQLSRPERGCCLLISFSKRNQKTCQQTDKLSLEHHDGLHIFLLNKEVGDDTGSVSPRAVSCGNSSVEKIKKIEKLQWMDEVLEWNEAVSSFPRAGDQWNLWKKICSAFFFVQFHMLKEQSSRHKTHYHCSPKFITTTGRCQVWHSWCV